jgi:hypothetical protein
VSGTPAVDDWTFYKFGLLVTGKGEEKFLPAFMRSLASGGQCAFHVIRRIPQRSPITSTKKKLHMIGTGKVIPDKDVSEIGLPTRNYLDKCPNSFVILVDDLEYDRRDVHKETFERYRAVLDNVLPEGYRKRASVHFLVNMMEAYYFADADAVNTVLGTNLMDFEGDVEAIRHPKAELKKLKLGFDEVVDGWKIVERLDLDKILGNPDTCASLRTLFKWCWRARREVYSDQFQLGIGSCSPITVPQVEALQQDNPT